MRSFTRWNESALAWSFCVRSRPHSTSITASPRSGLRRRSERKSLRESASRRTGASVFTEAERGARSRSAISPTNDPASRNSRIFSRPSSESFVTFTRPSRMMYM